MIAEKAAETVEDTKISEDMKRGLDCLHLELESASSGQPLFGSWKGEESGWIRVDCILESGASGSFCPLRMYTDWPVEDSAGSKLHLHYIPASGGQIKNRGQQRLPIQLSNGTRSHALFEWRVCPDP